MHVYKNASIHFICHARLTAKFSKIIHTAHPACMQLTPNKAWRRASHIHVNMHSGNSKSDYPGVLSEPSILGPRRKWCGDIVTTWTEVDSYRLLTTIEASLYEVGRAYNGFMNDTLKALMSLCKRKEIHKINNFEYGKLLLKFKNATRK